MTASLLILVRDAWQVFRWRLPFLFMLTWASAVLEGLTLAMLLPLLAVLGFGDSAAGPDAVTGAVTKMFGALDIPFRSDAIGVLLLAMLAVSAMVFVLQAYFATRLQAAYVAHWQNKVFGALAAANWRFLRRQRSGDIVGSMTTEALRLGGAFYQANLIVSSTAFLVAQATIAGIIAPKIIAAMALLAVALFGASRPLMRRALTLGGELTRANADLYATAGELVGGFKTVKATGREDDARKWVGGAVERIELLSFKSSFDIQLVRSMFEYASGAAVVTLLIAGPLLLGVEIGVVIVVVAMFVRLFPKVTALRQCMQSFGLALPAYHTLRTIVADAGAAREAAAGTTALSAAGPAAISFRRVGVQGEAAEHILQEVEFDVPPGAFVAVVGATGAGKTTLVDCVLALTPPSSGDVLIDGTSIHSIPLIAWRQSIGYLGQDPVLFAASIGDNVRWGRAGIDDAAVVAALEAADAGFVLRLPAGIDTLVTERGGVLSGGERQRIALARALAGDSRLLILDEATSALDAETEKAVVRSIAALKGKVTIIAVTHRSALVEAADVAVALEVGRVISVGSPHDLWERETGLRGLDGATQPPLGAATSKG